LTEAVSVITEAMRKLAQETKSSNARNWPPSAWMAPGTH